jgi:hypothetical protein
MPDESLDSEVVRPDRVKSAVSRLLNMSEREFEKLLAVLDASPILRPSHENFIDYVVEAMPEEDPDDLENTLRFMLAIASAWVDRRENDIGQIAENLVRDALNYDASAELIEASTNRLLRILNVDSLMLTARASTLMRAHSQWMLSPTVTTDIRPVFLPSQPERVRGTIVWHTLNIEFTNDPLNSESKRIEFAMDHRDLVRLRREVEVALAVQAGIQNSVTVADQPVWDPKDDSEEGER